MRYILLILALFLVVPFAQAQKPSDEDKSADQGLFGIWEYTVRPDDPFAQGTFVLEDTGSQINGTFNTDAPRKMDNIELTDAVLAFSFTQPGMGLIAINFVLEDGGLTGTATPEGADEPLPIVAARPGTDSDSPEE